MLALMLDHWFAACLLIVSAGVAGSMVVAAAVEPFAPCRRGNCPRCKGTGGEALARKAGAP